MFAICIAITPICTALAQPADAAQNRLPTPVFVAQSRHSLDHDFAQQMIYSTIDLLRNQLYVILFSARRSNNAGRVVMRTKFLFALIIFSSLNLCAADKATPLNIKEGLWEMTVTHSMTGMPTAAIPPETLAKMPPEQRARVEAAMKQRGMGGPATDVHKECVTKEKLEKQMAFDENRKDKDKDQDKDCTRTIVNSTGSKLEMKFHCEQSSTDGTLLLEAVTSDSVKGSMHSVTNSRGRTMNMDFTFSSRYVGPVCGDVK
jgi:hypothetical protein